MHNNARAVRLLQRLVSRRSSDGARAHQPIMPAQATRAQVLVNESSAGRAIRLAQFANSPAPAPRELDSMRRPLISDTGTTTRSHP